MESLTRGEYALAELSLQHACITSSDRVTFASLSAPADEKRAKGAGGRTMDDRDEFEELLAEELESGITRADVLKRGAAAGAGIARGVGALRARDRVRGDGSAVVDADLLPVDLRQLPRHPEADQQGLREAAQARREDRAGRGVRDRALRRRGEEEEEHVGRVRRHDALRRDGLADRGRARSSRGTTISPSPCSTT